MVMFALILLLPAAITILGKVFGAIPSNRAAAFWIVGGGCVPAIAYAAIMLGTRGPTDVTSIVNSPIVIVIGVAVAWVGFAAWPSGWGIRR